MQATTTTTIPKMPAVEDEEETLCLLSAQEVASPTLTWTDTESKRESKKNLVQLKEEPDDEDDENHAGWSANEADTFLAAGRAEQAFYSVCHSNDEAEEEGNARKPIKTTEDKDSLEVVHDILGVLEADHDKDVKNRQDSQVENQKTKDTSSSESAAPSQGASGQNHLSMVATSATSRSLVVDVHLPPAEEIVHEGGNSDTASSLVRPCKHEINRFQRCYSDGSQASPSRKSKGVKGRSQVHATHHPDAVVFKPDALMQEDALENVDRIDTVLCETDGPNYGRSKAKDKRYRHSSETVGFNVNFKGSTQSEGSSGLRGAAFGLHQELLQFKQSLLEGRQSDYKLKRKSDSEMAANGGIYSTDSPSPLVKFEVENHHDEEDEEDEEDDEEDFDKGDNGCKKAKKGHHYPRLNSLFGGSSSFTSTSLVGNATNAVSDSSAYPKEEKVKANKPSPYTFFTMDSDDDFDLYGSDLYGIDCSGSTTGMENKNALVDEHQSCLSQSSSTISMPVCRICQLPSMEPSNHLISPCRCLGSIRYVHNNCLLKWLEVSSKRRNGPPCCELCQYQYLRHKKFVISHWRFPECSLKDKILHLFFIISVCLMIACAAVTIICFKEERGPYRNANKYRPGELSPPEMITLSCGVLFFLAFFLAMYVEVKAKNTVYQLICKFFYMNHEWSVEEYDRKRDIVSSKKRKEKEAKKQKKRNRRGSHSSSTTGNNLQHA